MTSSGMKRGLAAVAVSALSVTGLPLLAGTAHATPIASTFGDANDVAWYSVLNGGVSDKNDGTNETVSLVTGGGANVTSVLYQYALAAAPTTWVDVPGGLVARNADGVFAFDWANPPATLVAVRAVPNTGLAEAVEQAALTVPDATANTVELATEGALGVFQEPYTETTGSQDLLGVTGTASGNFAVDVSDVSHGTAGSPASATVTNDGVASTTETFNAVLNIDGYPYSPGAEPNQIALNASSDNTDDAEGSTLYVQTIGSIEAVPELQEKADPTTSVITLTVKDTAGKPVAGAQVGLADLDTDGAGPDTDGADTILGYTDGKGQFVDEGRTTAGTFTYFVNTTDNNELEAGVDPSDTATVTTYTPVLSSVDIVNERNRANFDIDELSDGDDFTIVTKDQRGNPINEDLTGADIEYRWIIDPSGAGDTFTSAWIPGETGADGKFAVPALTDTSYNGGPVPEGTYTLEARRPNVGGTGLTNATPETFAASESEISYDEGASANAPVNGEFTVTGTLANDGGGLAGREIQLSYTPGGDSSFAPQASQPAGVTVTTPTTAVVVTDANGDFSVKLRDPQIPANVTPTPENGTLNAIAEETATDSTSLQGALGPNDSTVANDPDNAEQDLAIHWIQTPTVHGVSVTMDNLYGAARPGAPVDLDIEVDGSSTAGMQALSDFPVEVTVDHGFVSPNAETKEALTPAAGAGDAGDLWGVWQNDGASETVSTGDAAKAGAVAAIERDAGFDDDGLVQTTVTVKAGNVTETRTILWSSSNPLNGKSVSVDPMTGEPQGNVQIGQTVDHNVVTLDQFDNRVGDESVRMFDNTDDAHFTTDAAGDFALSDFVNGGASVTAYGEAPTSQTLEGRWTTEKTVHVAGADSSLSESQNLLTDTAPAINWVSGRTAIEALLKLSNQADGDDVARVNAPSVAAGAKVKLYKIRKDGTRKWIATKTANANGNAKFVVNDTNGRKYTKYQAKVVRTADTFADWTPKKRIR